MKHLLAAGALAMAATGATTAAWAQEFHAGFSLDYASPTEGDSQTAISGIAGVTFGRDVLTYGVEAEAGVPLGGNTDYDTTRFRAIGLYDLGDYEVLGAAGFTRYGLADDSEDGVNFGLGVQRDYSDWTILRAEFIRDNMSSDNVPDATTARIGVLFNF
ncbi:hypothetical protein [Yoonia sediminilitoris]|uniref:Outer membrane protein beta-barrel domain-containing protein n=1 Tax=Yoonia sediminilitoris TaxID=1286148 RepID=A0A2T6KB46_9RHOB|nr:hypothetical protein [Yoonia sediminilitoris]PUB12078.1 hypothetical protein C8N45_11155 [Yoonia sediminilitoris]RCW92905.1 hypothetical protein DFP92_11154 [Yoonia sediminilitoris]